MCSAIVELLASYDVRKWCRFVPAGWKSWSSKSLFSHCSDLKNAENVAIRRKSQKNDWLKVKKINAKFVTRNREIRCFKQFGKETSKKNKTGTKLKTKQEPNSKKNLGKFPITKTRFRRKVAGSARKLLVPSHIRSVSAPGLNSEGTRSEKLDEVLAVQKHYEVKKSPKTLQLSWPNFLIPHRGDTSRNWP